jgi:hypothetical protein
MNAYPSWIHRIPEMIEALALADIERIDRQAAERLFDLRATAAKALLRRLGAEMCGHALVISRARLMSRLREALEHPDWKWEAERRRTIRHRVQATRPEPSRRSVVPVTGEFWKTLDQMGVPELPATIELLPGKVIIQCQNMEHLLQQLVQLAKTLDNDYETLQRLIEPAPARRPPGLETASTPLNLRGDALG